MSDLPPENERNGKHVEVEVGREEVEGRHTLIHSASFVTCVMATYSDSVVESDTKVSFLEFQEITPPSMQNTWPEITW